MYRTFEKNEEELVLKTLRKRRNIYTIMFIIFLFIGGFIGVVSNIAAFVFMALWGIAAGLAMYCINNIRYIQSGGRKKGGGLLWVVLFILGLIIIPVITVQLSARISPLSKLVLGV